MSKDIATLQAEIDQLKFLLASAPMTVAPVVSDPGSRTRLMGARTKFAYIHPKTISGFTWGMPPKRAIKFPGSPTLWLLTSLMPEGRIIFSDLPIPGFEKLVIS
jgi:hypothetical protein